MKKTQFTIVFLLVYTWVFGQKSFIQSTTLFENSLGAVKHFGVADEEFIYVMHIEGDTLGEHFYLLKTDTTGNVVDSNYFGRDVFIDGDPMYLIRRDLVIKNDLIYYPVLFNRDGMGQSAILAFNKFDLEISFFDTLDRKECGLIQSFYINSVNQILCLCNNTRVSQNKYSIVTLSESLKSIRVDTIVAERNRIYPSFITKDQNDNLVIVGRERIDNSDSSKIFIDLIDKDFTLIRRDRITYGERLSTVSASDVMASMVDGENVSIRADESIIVNQQGNSLNYPRLYSYNINDGTVSWETAILEHNQELWPRNHYPIVAHTLDGHVIMAGGRLDIREDSLATGTVHVISYSESGTLRWNHQHNLTELTNDTLGQVQIFDVIDTGHGIVVTGAVADYSESKIKSLYIKLDSNGCLRNNCDIIVGQSKILPPEISLEVSENVLRMNGATLDPLKIVIGSINGQILKTYPWQNNGSIHLDLPKGVYFASVMGEKAPILSKNILILR